MTQPCRYTVLYYKRTNKVHKHRGTSRQDGILSIAPPPLCSVSLLDNDVADAGDDDDDSDDDIDDNGKNKYYRRHSKNNTKKRTTKKQKKNAPKKPKSGAVIYSGVNSELAKRAADIQEDDEIVLSGQWECLIISKLDGHDEANNGDNKSESNKKLVGAPHSKIGTQKSRGIMNNHGKGSSLLASSKSKNPLLMKQRGALMSKPGGLTSRSTGGANVGASVGNSNSSIRAPLHSVKSNNEEEMMNKSSKLAVGADGLKAPAQGAMKSNAAASLSSATAMASGKMKKDKNGEWYLDKSSNDDDDDDNAASASTIKTLRKTNIPSSLVRGAKASSTLGAGLMRKRPLGSIGGGVSSGGGLLKRSSIAQPRSTMSS
eukprot:scaffold24952_cov140-Skeletonema_marinoi.AAC.1